MLLDTFIDHFHTCLLRCAQAFRSLNVEVALRILAHQSQARPEFMSVQRGANLSRASCEDSRAARFGDCVILPAAVVTYG